jgi:hypothetical protein
MRPATKTTAGRRKLSLVPAARPAARPTTASAPADSDGSPSRRTAQALSAMAMAASRKKIPTMSLRASPAWSASAGTLKAIAPRLSDQGATR